MISSIICLVSLVWRVSGEVGEGVSCGKCVAFVIYYWENSIINAANDHIVACYQPRHCTEII